MRAANNADRKDFEEKSWKGKLGDILLVFFLFGIFIGLPFYHAAETWIGGEPLMAMAGLLPVLVCYVLVFLTLQVVR